MAPSITEMKLKLIEIKNNPLINLSLDNKYANLTVEKSKDIKDEENISFKIKDMLMCEQVYNITNEVFKINKTKINNIKDNALMYNNNNEFLEPNITSSKTIIGQNNLKSTILRYCNYNSIIEFDVIK